MRRILPGPHQSVSIAEAYDAPLGHHPDRPWIGLSMVTSLDGSTVVDGASAGLSSSNDSEVFLRLRAVADVILVGAGTARGEGYGPPSKSGQRIGVVTGSGSVDTTTPLFTSGSGFVVTTDTASFETNGVDVIRAGRDEVDLAAAAIRITELCPGCSFIQAEGGATLNGSLAAADLLDEINLTFSPLTVGGEGARLTNTSVDLQRRFEVDRLFLDDESFLFTRWRRVR